jgi:hypothetical protein
MGSGASTVAVHKPTPQCNAANSTAVSTKKPEIHDNPAQQVAAQLEAASAAGSLEIASEDAEPDIIARLDALDNTSAADTLTGCVPLHDSELQRTANLKQQCMTQDSEAVAEVVPPSDWKDPDNRPSSDTYSVLPTVTKLAISRARSDSLDIDSDDDATPREQCESPQKMSMLSTGLTQSHYVSDRCNNADDHHARYSLNIYIYI